MLLGSRGELRSTYPCVHAIGTTVGEAYPPDLARSQMEVYDRVAKDVAPKRARLAQAEAEYAEVSALLETKKAALKEVEDKIAALQAQFAETTQRKEELEKQADDCTKKLDRASKLIGGLGGEKDRWTEASAALGEVYNNIVGDVLIGSGVVSYMGPFTATFRDRVITDWIQLCAQKKVMQRRGFRSTMCRLAIILSTYSD